MAAERAQRLFEEWRERELTAVRAQYEAQYAELKKQTEAQYAAMLAEKVETVKKEYEALSERWKQEYEEKIRQDAVQRSLATPWCPTAS